MRFLKPQASVSFASGTFDGTVTAGNDGTAINQIVGYAVQNSSPSDNNVDMNDFGTNWLASGWIRFAKSKTPPQVTATGFYL